jgi:hypothetical protein
LSSTVQNGSSSAEKFAVLVMKPWILSLVAPFLPRSVANSFAAAKKLSYWGSASPQPIQPWWPASM